MEYDTKEEKKCKRQGKKVNEVWESSILKLLFKKKNIGEQEKHIACIYIRGWKYIRE